MPEKALDLSSPSSAVKGIGPAKYNALADAGIHTINDLINHYPRRYLDRTNITQISKIKNKTQVNLVGKVVALGMVRGRKRQFFKAMLTDKSGTVTLTWFRGARYMNQTIKAGDILAVSGKAEFYNGMQIVHPEYDRLNKEDNPINSGIITPLYSISGELKKSRVDSRFLRKIFSSLFKNLNEIPDFLGRDFCSDHNLISIGRLDYNSEGLLLLTNSGSFKRKMELPKNNFERVYKVRVQGFIDKNFVDRLSKGLRIKHIKYKPIKVSLISKTKTYSWIKMSLLEGKNREIRNIFESLNITVTRLIRISYGAYKLSLIHI